MNETLRAGLLYLAAQVIYLPPPFKWPYPQAAQGGQGGRGGVGG